ncbi:MAG: flagellar biosynthetic protein FliR [Defluviitaleaceae bacterium]|nr:flagellar biosynthetic protein FliR [Defluviitaleaceae bacterium]
MESLPIIAAFYEQIDVFMLVLVRTLAFFIFLPVISGMSIPMLVRLLLAVVVGASIFSSGIVTAVVATETLPAFTLAILTEFLAGLMMSYIIYFVFSIILYAGQVIDFMMGLAMVNMVDPLLQIQVPIVGNLFFMAIMALMVVTDGLANFMWAFMISFEILPIGAAFILGNQPIIEFIVLQMTTFVIMGVQIAVPIIGALTIINVALGVMVKAAPQMNVFVVGMPLKIIIGFFLLLTTMAGPVNRIYRYLFTLAYDSLAEIIWGLRPDGL